MCFDCFRVFRFRSFIFSYSRFQSLTPNFKEKPKPIFNLESLTSGCHLASVDRSRPCLDEVNAKASPASIFFVFADLLARRLSLEDVALSSISCMVCFANVDVISMAKPSSPPSEPSASSSSGFPSSPDRSVLFGL